MKVINKILFLTIFFIPSLHAQNELDLERLIQIALENNSDIKIARFDNKQKKEDIKSSKSSFYPKLSAKADISSYEINQNTSVIKDNNVKTYSLSANQLIYDFGKSKYKVDISKKNLEISQKDLIIIINKTILSVSKAYYEILKNGELINVSKESLKIDTLQLDKVQNYLNAGIKTKIDLTNAKLSLSTSKLDLIKAKYSLKQSYSKLITILGNKEKYTIKENSFNLLKIKNSIKKLENNLEYYVNEGLNNRIELKRYKDLLKSNKLDLKSQKSNYYPKIDFNANYTDNSSNEDSLNKDQTVAGVYISWDFFTGFSTDANVKKSLLALNKTSEKLVQDKLLIEENITDAYILVVQNYESFLISFESLGLAKQNLFLAQERYKHGLNDIFELNTSKLQFIEAKSNLTRTYYDYKKSQAILSFESGLKI